MLPLFYKKSSTPAMIKHGMDMIQQATEFLNPGQIPVITMDQPLFAIAKYVQWFLPEKYGEDHFVIMLGGLHIEMALCNTIGDLLEGSGWITILTEAEVGSSGISQSFLKASHLTRTRYAHQVTLLSLYTLLMEAYAKFDQSVPFEIWKERMKVESPTFYFWHLIMQLEIQVLMFVRAHRTKDFDLYVQSLESLVYLFFALDHVNYACWLPVHIRDMKTLPTSIKDQFSKGNWVISKTKKDFQVSQ
jgi:hypothetical protein